MSAEMALKSMRDALGLLDSLDAKLPAAHLAGAIDCLQNYVASNQDAGPGNASACALDTKLVEINQ